LEQKPRFKAIQDRYCSRSFIFATRHRFRIYAGSE
jgi:hypothetical protein